MILIRSNCRDYNLTSVASMDIKFYPVMGRCLVKGKFLSEALILASTNPQYDKRLFIELLVQYLKFQAQNMLCTQIVFVLTFRNIYVHFMF